MSKKNRIYYKPKWATLNGRYISSLRDVGMTTTFNLQMCFCSCPLPLQSMMDELDADGLRPLDGGKWIEIHNDTCPNANPATFLRYVTDQEKAEYRENNRRWRENT